MYHAYKNYDLGYIQPRNGGIKYFVSYNGDGKYFIREVKSKSESFYHILENEFDRWYSEMILKEYDNND